MRLNHLITNVSGKVPLRAVLIIPFLVQMVITVGAVGYLSFTNGQRAVEDLASQLMGKVSDRIHQQLKQYLESPLVINRINADAIQQKQLNLQESNSLTRHFWKQRFLFDTVCGAAIYFGSPQGEFTGLGLRKNSIWLIGRAGKYTNGKYYSYAVDSQGNATNLKEINENYDPRKRPWYQDAIQARTPIWSRVYPDFSQQSAKIALAQPVYDSSGKLLGVIGVDCLLSSIGDFLKHIEVGQSGETFIIERNGALIASSSSKVPFNEQKIRISALESHNLEIRSTAFYLKKRFGNLSQIDRSEQLSFNRDGKRQLVRVTPFTDELGLDFLIVVVLPESDFMAQINANTRLTILLCLGAFILAIVIGIVTAGWVTRPILKLSVASSKIASGEFNQIVNAPGIQELNVLAASFNQMNRDLQKSQSQLEDYARSLEEKVASRTQSLEQEISDRKRTEAELAKAKAAAEAASLAKSTFLANMSHELRSPLNAIIGFTQLMNRSQNLTPEQRDNLAIINRSGEHLLDLINDILDLSKIEAGRSTLNAQNFDLYRLLDDLEDMFQLKAESKQLQLIFQRKPDVPQYIRTDPRKLRQVLINLLSNGIKFTPAGSVTVRVGKFLSLPHTSPQAVINFEVEDTGVGIPANEIDLIFEPFVQAETGRRSQEGTGLGLPIARQFVQMMGGDITVKSEVGCGTIFQFNIVANIVASSDTPASLSSQRAIGLAPDQPAYRILVVDDKDYNLSLLIQLLQPLGFDVKTARNGVEAIEIWDSFEPHFIWMDMRMPVMNGYEATKRIKATAKGQATKIVALTASTLEEERSTIFAAGCDDFLHKPFREIEILQMMTRQLGVQFIYENNSILNSNFKQNNSGPLTSEHLVNLSDNWLTSLYEAAVLADAEEALRLIEQIRTEHTNLAAVLTQLIHNFDFETIEQLISTYH